MKTEITVRKAASDDVSALARMLARAFQDDPALSWAAPDPNRRKLYGPTYFEQLLRRTYLPKGEVHMVEIAKAGALWAPPGKWYEPISASLPFWPTMLKACGRHLPRAFRMLALIETRHKHHADPHYYLGFIATDPDSQGNGYGSALLGNMLERCDSENMPAYLEATSPRNQSLYARHGFEVVEELNWPGGGPPFWRMWREPISRGALAAQSLGGDG